MNELITEATSELAQLFESRKLEIIADLETNIPDIQADNRLLCQAIINILKHSIVSSPPNKSISISTAIEDDEVIIKITHTIEHVSNAEIEQFFFPHIEPNLEESVLDLPLSKIIVHRHGGKIDLACDENNILKIIISFPTKPV